MRKNVLFLITIMIFSMLSPNKSFGSEDFCEGYQEGYKEGICDGKFSCLPPLPPLCPLPKIGETNFKDGYNRGFKEGLRKQNN